MHGFYIIQGIMSGSVICYEDSTDDEIKAIRDARKLKQDATFEGEYTRVITLDGEGVYDSREDRMLS